MSDRNIIKSNAEYTRSYENMRGVSAGGDKDATERFEYLENMYIDYEGDADAIESVPGFRSIAAFSGRINGIFMQRLGTGEEYLIVHAGDGVYRLKNELPDSASDISHEPLITAEDTESRAFSVGTSIFLIDGRDMIRIDSEGGAERISKSSSYPYVPTTYVDGEAHEARNLLTDEFYERFTVKALSENLHGTPTLSYKILSESERTCTVTGASQPLVGSVYIPSKVKIGGAYYTVKTISAWALRSQTRMTELYTSPGLTEIEDCALWECTGLLDVMLSDTVERIGQYAFFGASSLGTVYLGTGLREIDPLAFYGCNSIITLHYAGLEETFELISGHDSIVSVRKSFASSYTGILVEIPIHTVNGSVSEVLVGGTPHDFKHDVSNGAVLLRFSGRSYIDGGEVVIHASFGSLDREGFLGSELAIREEGYDPIYGCRLAEVFDGRIFLSGNPRLAGAVFYSALDSAGQANPFYFPADGYFIDGVGDYPVSAMLSAEDSLFVFKSEDDGSGSVFRHIPDGGKYPVACVRKDLRCYPAVASFLGESLFLSSVGVTAIETGSYSSKSFETVSRSEGIRSRLSAEELSSVRFCRFGSYIAVCAGTGVYLGDSHDTYRGKSGAQYEWYPLTGVCSYTGDSRVYRYSGTAPEGFAVNGREGEVADGVIMSTGDGAGGLIYFVESGGERIAVYPTDEWAGGTPSKITAVLGGELFFFGTEGGVLSVFNTDKRGAPPPTVASLDGFDAADYEKKMGRRIHPYYYSFGGHAQRSALKTKSDTCALPYLRKSTVRSSLTVRCKSLGGGRIVCEIGTDREAFRRVLETPVGGFNFESTDFSSLTLSADGTHTLAIPDSTKGWTEKSIALYSDAFCSPIGIYSINYRYRIKGRII